MATNKRAIRLDQSMKKFVPRTPNISLYYNDVISKTDRIYDNQKTKDLLLEYKTAEGERKTAIRNKIIELNLRLVISVARKNCCAEDNLLDLIEEGNIGLIKAVDKYDTNKESCFAKLAMYYITGAIRYYKHHSSQVISIKNRPKTNALIRSITNDYLQKENRNPTCEELMEEYNKRSKSKYNYTVMEDFMGAKIIGIDCQFNNAESSPYEVSKERLDYTNKTCSYNKSEENADAEYNQELTKNYLKLLSPRESKIIEMIYGLGETKKEYSYKSIAKIMNLTDERIRQIHFSAIEKLKEKLIPNYNK